MNSVLKISCYLLSIDIAQCRTYWGFPVGIEYIVTSLLWVEYSTMVQETGVQSHTRLKKWYLILPWWALSIKRYVSRVKWNNPVKVVALPLHLEKGALGSTSTMVANLLTYHWSVYLVYWSLHYIKCSFFYGISVLCF